MKIDSKVIIFDFDGVIVDSEHVYYSKWKEASEYYGINLTNEKLLSLRSACKEVAKDVFKDEEEFLKVRMLRRKLVEEHLAVTPFKIKNNIREAFIKLKEMGYKIYIASSSLPKMITDHLDLYDLNKYIEKVLTVHDVKRGKPFPDIYINICNTLNLNPNDVLAVEDSPNGVNSAYSAGLKVCMIPDATEPTGDLLEKLDIVCKDALELANILE